MKQVKRTDAQTLGKPSCADGKAFSADAGCGSVTLETADPADLTGLTTEQALALAANGLSNRLPRAADGGVAAIVRRNIFTLFNLLNCVLAALLVMVGSYRNLLFMGVVVSNALIGLVQELRAKRTHDRLLLLSQGKAHAIRDGVETAVAPGDLVLGDIVRLRRGDQTPADARVLLGNAEFNEALLTGESVAIPKRSGDALLSGSYVTEGAVTARLTAVGAASFAGKLQQNARKVRRAESALMASLNQMIRVVSIVLLPIGLLLYFKQQSMLPLATAVTRTVAATLGMIPEGLVLLTSVALAVGVVRLGKRNTLVNELYGIENLARVDMLCLDKTGTLTTGRMSVRDVIPLDATPMDAIHTALRAFAVTFTKGDGPTATALAEAFKPLSNLAPDATVPFSSDRKWSAAQFATLGTLVLGAPEKTAVARGDVQAAAERYASEGLRVLALCRTDAPIGGKTLPPDLQPLALVLVGDALRPEAAQTLRYFDEQAVDIRILSGDSALTVARIARDAGLSGASQAVDCASLSAPLPYDRLARDYTVFGRVSPDDKRELIAAFKRQGRTVGMIGDGVNDVPALKAADCSIAMAGGSDAAARVAQITLLDADFSTMPEIVLEGRRVINNITRAAALFLVKNLFSFILATLTALLPLTYPFAPIQLTLVSSLTIGLPSFVLALQPNRERVRGKFLKNVLLRALPGGVTVATVCLGMMFYGQSAQLTDPVVSTLCTLVAAFTGLCVLALTCLPMDAVRAALTAAMTAGTAFAVLLFPEVFYLVPLQGVALRALLVAFAAAVCLLALLTRIMRKALQANTKPENSAKR